jgi:copper(I)-binding protein
VPAKSAPASVVTVEGPYVRLMPPASTRTGAFLVLKNPSAREVKLVRAATDAAKVVELHTHINEGGVMKMRPVPFIAVPAGGSTTLEPGGLHIMLIDLVRPLAESQNVKLTLSFDDGSELVVDAPVRPIKMR